MDKRTGTASRLLAASLCAALLLISPGPSAYAAAGQIANIKVTAPVGVSMGLVGGSLNAGTVSALNTRLGLTPLSLTAHLAPGQAAPVVMAQDLAVVQAPALESPIVVAETLASLSAAPLLAAPAAERGTAVPAGGSAAMLAQAEAIQAEGGRMAEPAARVKTGVLQTLRSIFSSAQEDSSIPVAEPEAAGSRSSSLEPSSPAETPVQTAAPAAPSVPAQAAPASKIKTVLRWALPIVALTALVYGLDFGTKYLAVKYLFTAFHECAWRAPLLAGIIPYIGVTAFIARKSLANDHTTWRWSPGQLGNGRLGFYKVALSGMDEMVKDHPSLRWAVRIYDVSIALMLGGMLGNGIDAFRLGGALDWIPLGRSLMNFADVALLWGLAFFQLATDFFIQAAKAHHEGKPLHFSTVSFLGLPLLGFFLAWTFGSAAGGGALDLAMKSVGWLYVMGFSMLLGISRFLASLVVDRFAKKFVSEQGAKKPA
ncbi:MAG: signal peptidase II [Elusimicrobia bacterium]|nr:signal peptidase II [Elusimicrobiota bacterium]